MPHRRRARAALLPGQPQEPLVLYPGNFSAPGQLVWTQGPGFGKLPPLSHVSWCRVCHVPSREIPLDRPLGMDGRRRGVPCSCRLRTVDSAVRRAARGGLRHRPRARGPHRGRHPGPEGPLLGRAAAPGGLPLQPDPQPRLDDQRSRSEEAVLRHAEGAVLPPRGPGAFC